MIIGLIPAAIAQGKGRSFLGWWLFGALLFIVALPCALIVDALPGSVKANERAALAGAAQRFAAPSSSVTDEILKAKSLLDAGAISHAEFERIKARLV